MTISKAVELRDDMLDYVEKSFDLTRDGDPTVSNDLWAEETRAQIDSATIESLFFTEDWVYIVVDLCASKLSQLPLLVMRQTLEDGVANISYDDTHPLNALINSPNDWQDQSSFVYGVFVNFFLLGNSIIWYSPANRHLINLRSAITDIDFDRDGKIKAYLLNDRTDEQHTTNRMRFDARDILHIRRPNPASMIWGLSPFIPGRKSVLFNRYSTDYLNAFYLKQATPGMALEMDKTVNEAQALRQLRTFEMAYTGRRNQRRTMILPKGVSAKQMSHTIADQRLTDLIVGNRETVLNLLRVPKHELGLQTAGSLGSEEYKTALKNFWDSTLKPAATLFEGMFNKFFKSQLGPNHFFKFDMSNVSALQDDLNLKAETAQKMLQAGLSINEVRIKIWDEEPLDLPQAEVPFILRQQTSPSFEMPRFESGPVAQESEPLENRTQKIISKYSIEVETISKQISEEADDSERGRHMFEVALEMLTTLAETSIPIIRRELVETKAEIPSKTRLRRDLQKAFDNFEQAWVDEYIATLSTSVDLGYNQMLNMVFNAPDRERVEALRARDANGRRLILEARGIESFAQITATHTNRIMAEITRGAERNETIEQIARRIANTFANPEEMRSKAMTIARTEVLTAVSVGQAAAMQNAKEAIPGLKKTWLNSGLPNIRDEHLDVSDGGVSGEVRDVDEAFSNGLMYPRDPSGEAGSNINCRCTLLIIPPGEDV